MKRDGGYLAGVDVGGTSAKIGLFDTDGALLDQWEVATGKEKDAETSLGEIADTIRAHLSALHASCSDLCGAGLTVPGPVLPGGFVPHYPNLNWGNHPVKETLSRFLSHCPVEIVNDANAAALGELWKGAGEGKSSLVMVTLGTGVGGGIVVNGQVISGANGAGGEIGHMHVSDEETERCGCGKAGCLEQFASASGLVRVAKKYLDQQKQTASVLRKKADFSAKDVCDAAKGDDPLASEAFDTMCQMLGVTLARIACVTDPDLFVIGGGVSRAGLVLTDAVSRYYQKTAFFASRHTPIVLARLGNDAGIYGAARMLLT